MLCCLNPDCEKPLNPENNKHCHQCETVLVPLLRHRFRVLKPLGKGGFGKTYLAEDTDKLMERCVIKQLIYRGQGVQTTKKVIELFMREAEQLRNLKNNPQIPDLIAHFEENGYLYLVQEYIEGTDLLQELEAEGPFSDAKIMSLLANLLPILAFIHRRGVIHRDLKPDNIMRRQRDNRLILIDFGVSRGLSQAVTTMAGTMVGSLGYVAAEQMESGNAQPASDLYSLGATCFHLIAGVLPWTYWKKQGYGWVDQWRSLVPRSVSNELGLVLDRLLCVDLSGRYQSADMVLQDLATPLQPSLPAPRPDVSQPQVQMPLPMLESSALAQTLPLAPMPLKKKGRRRFLMGIAGAGIGAGGALLWDKIEQWRREAFDVVSLQQFEFEVVTVDELGAINDRRTEQAEFFVETLGEGVTLEMVAILGGTFLMGSQEDEAGRNDDEDPQHQVTVPAFFAGKFTITQAQWAAVAALPKVRLDLESDPAYFKGKNHPVDRVSWLEAIEFCQRLAKKTGRNYRLLSEAEWEYACRAGTKTPFYFGATITPELANYDGNDTYGAGPTGLYREKTVAVGTFPANAFGLYDMHGNVSEWCADSWHFNYDDAPTDGSARQGTNDFRCRRGGSWLYGPQLCRSAYRTLNGMEDAHKRVGFRVACSVPYSIRGLS